MKVIVAAGGTGGHIYPACALATELLTQGDEVTFLTRSGGLDEALVEHANLQFHECEAYAFNRSRPWTALTSTIKNKQSAKRLRAFYREYKPDVLVVFGGYVSLPAADAAKKEGIPFILHEQNSVPGLANKLLSSNAQAIALTYSQAKEGFKADVPFVMTGNPVRTNILDAEASRGRKLYDIPEDARVLLVFGGSLGALHVNQAIVCMKEELMAIPDLHVIQVTGDAHFDRMKEELQLTEEENKRWHLVSYCHDMGNTMAAADLIVCRAGATSLSEISLVGKPSILVPYPYAAADEQTKNAQDLVQANAAILIKDSELDSSTFSLALLDLVQDKEKLVLMGQNAKKCAFPDSAKRIAALAHAVYEGSSFETLK